MTACSCPKLASVGRAQVPVVLDADCPVHGIPEKASFQHPLRKYAHGVRRGLRGYEANESLRQVEQRLYQEARP